MSTTDVIVAGHGVKVTNGGDIFTYMTWREFDKLIKFVRDAKQFAKNGIEISIPICELNTPSSCKLEGCSNAVVNTDKYIGTDEGYCLNHAWQCRQFECVSRVPDRGAVCQTSHAYTCYKCYGLSDSPNIPCSSCQTAIEEDSDDIEDIWV